MAKVEIEKPNYSPEKKESKKIVKNKVRVKEKTIGQKFMNLFVADDIKSFGTYILEDIIVLAAKNMICDVLDTASDSFGKAIEEVLFGSDGRRKKKRSGTQSYVSYDQYSNRKVTRANMTNSSRRNDVSDVIFESKADAMEVLDQMVDMIEEFGEVSIAHFYDLVDVRMVPSDNDYGWNNLSAARVRPIRGGEFIIDFPRPIRLE